MTNYERIKVMTVEEMAKWLYVVTGTINSHTANGYRGIRQWLESEVQSDDR